MDSDKEAIVDFVKNHKELYNKTNFSRTKQRRNVSGSSSPTATSCLSRCAGPGLSRRGHVAADQNKIWTGPEGDDGMLELDTG